MRELRGKAALVTGAGSGIGRATALLLAERGCEMVVCDRDPTRLQEVAAALKARGALLEAQVVDVADRAAMEAFAAAVHAHLPALDVLVNNAGVGLAGGLCDTSLEDWEWVLRINLWGVIHGLHYFVPPMARRGRGHVVNLASGLGLVAAPGTLGYSASKFAVVGISESLRAELQPQGIGVSVVCPGLVKTAIFADGRIRGAGAEAARAQITRLVDRWGATPEAVARAIASAIEGDRGLVLVSPEARFFWWMKRFAPWALPVLARLAPAPGAALPRRG